MSKRPLIVLSLAIFVTMVGNSMVMPFLPLYVREFGVGQLGAGLLFTVHAAARTLLLPLVGRVSDRYWRKRFLVGGFVLYAAAGAAYSHAGSLTAFVLTTLLHGTGTAVVHAVAMAYTGDLAPAGEEGVYSGYINTAFLGGVASGPIVGGVVSDLFDDMEANFLWLRVLSLCSLALVFFLPPETREARSGPHAKVSSMVEILSNRPIPAAAVL